MIMDTPIICSYREKGLWWFRIFGYGIHYKNSKYHEPLFSERTGRRRKLKLGRHRIRFLNRPRRMREAKCPKSN